MSESNQLREAVREHYARAAQRALRPAETSGSACCCCCCGPTEPAEAAKTASCCGATGPECGRSSGCTGDAAPVSGSLDDPNELSGLPVEAVAASLGCGNPAALAELRPGEVVLDLGSGGGLDVLLAARRVGPTGRAYGLDLTDEMLALARQNATRAGATNVEFLQGQIEEIPLSDESVDVVISNCVINLSTDKTRVLREAFRVLRPGGRLAVADVVVDGPVPADLRRQVELWVGCLAGALDPSDYRDRLASVGFADTAIEPTRSYPFAALGDQARGAELTAQSGEERSRWNQAFASAFIRARKPPLAR